MRWMCAAYLFDLFDRNRWKTRSSCGVGPREKDWHWGRPRGRGMVREMGQSPNEYCGSQAEVKAGFGT